MEKAVDKADVVKAMARFLRQPVEKLHDDAILTELVNESFVLVEMVIQLQEEFGVRFGQEELQGVKTVGDLTGLIAGIARK
jgi:acyl carrier protein